LHPGGSGSVPLSRSSLSASSISSTVSSSQAQQASIPSSYSSAAGALSLPSPRERPDIIPRGEPQQRPITGGRSSSFSALIGPENRARSASIQGSPQRPLSKSLQRLVEEPPRLAPAPKVASRKISGIDGWAADESDDEAPVRLDHDSPLCLREGKVEIKKTMIPRHLHPPTREGMKVERTAALDAKKRSRAKRRKRREAAAAAAAAATSAATAAAATAAAATVMPTTGASSSQQLSRASPLKTAGSSAQQPPRSSSASANKGSVAKPSDAASSLATGPAQASIPLPAPPLSTSASSPASKPVVVAGTLPLVPVVARRFSSSGFMHEYLSDEDHGEVDDEVEDEDEDVDDGDDDDDNDIDDDDDDDDNVDFIDDHDFDEIEESMKALGLHPQPPRGAGKPLAPAPIEEEPTPRFKDHLPTPALTVAAAIEAAMKKKELELSKKKIENQLDLH
jgi:hypothetical protein